MNYPRYSAYKDSGIPWVGDVPKDWEVNPVLAFANERKVKNTLGEETNVLSLSYGNIIQRDVESNFGLLPESFNTYQIVKEGNIILRLTDLQNDKKSLRVGLAKENGIITSAYLNLDFQKKVIPEYAYYLLHSYDLAKVFYSLGGGVRRSLGYDELRRVPFICPSPEEQENIVNFLKSETSQTDALIKKNEQLIFLLQEKRQAMISHAVTKGINPDAPMKDSGIEWLGEIPEHWKIKRLKYLVSVNDESLTEKTSDDYELEYVDIGSVSSNGEILKTETLKFKDSPSRARKVVRDGDTILSTVRTYLRAITYIDNPPDNLIASTGFAILRPKSQFVPKFMGWLLRAEFFIGKVVSESVGISYPAIAPTKIGDFFVVLPEKREQKEIVEFLEIESSKIDTLIDKAQQQIEKLKEHRSALISTAVAGKIDVREWNKREQAA